MSTNNPVIVRSQRVLLSEWQDRDFPEFAGMNADPEVMRFFPHPFSLEESAAAFERMRQQPSELGFGIWCARDSTTKEFIGSIGLAEPRFDEWFTPCVEIGWRVVRSQWGKGLATEAATAILDHAWSTLGLERIFSFTSLLNLPSIRVMQKIGMIRIGEFDHPRVESDSPLRRHVLYQIESQVRAV